MGIFETYDTNPTRRNRFTGDDEVLVTDTYTQQKDDKQTDISATPVFNLFGIPVYQWHLQLLNTTLLLMLLAVTMGILSALVRR